MVRQTLAAFLITAVGLLATQAQAMPVSYSIDGSGFYGNPVGSFTYDASTNRFSNVDIWSLDHFTSATGNATDRLMRATGALGSVLRLVFDSPLSDAGGVLTFSGYEQGVLTLGLRLRREGAASSNIVSGSGTGVYEPGATLLFILGLALVLLMPRRSLAASGH